MLDHCASQRVQAGARVASLNPLDPPPTGLTGRRYDRLRASLARIDRVGRRGYDLEGYIQPSSRRSDGHKLFALIGGEGKTIAYLDIPPGLDPDPYLSQRVGVRGQSRFNKDLGTRLITVRDLEALESRR